MAVDPIRGAGDPQLRVAGARTHALFEQHARMVYGLCRALLRDPDDADDATQATFVSAFRSLVGGSDVREPAAWLATIARNECAARARARMREPLPLLEADLRSAPGPEAELDRKAFVDELQRAIAELPEKQREAVVLRDLYGLRYTEVGAALGMSVASVESLLFRARRTLRISLKPLAGGALTVPVAVREGIAQALPPLTAARTAGGGAAAGAVGLGLLAKLSGGPAAVKAAAGVAAAVAAGSIAVVGVENVERQRPGSLRHPTQSQAGGGADLGGAAASSFVGAPARVAGSDARPVREVRPGRGAGTSVVAVVGARSDGSNDARREGDDERDDEGRAGADTVADDDDDEGVASDRSNHTDASRGHDGSAASRGDGGSDDAESREDVLGVEASHSGGSGDADDSESSEHSLEREDGDDPEPSEGAEEEEGEPEKTDSDESEDEEPEQGSTLRPV